MRIRTATDLGAFIRERRTNLGWDQVSLAASVIGLNPAIRDRVKSGHREWPKT
jgi:ribosome-binding protein aMBF1 (putative translation factor)